MDFMSILIFLLVLSFLVFFHELGHFLAAKACNIYVDRFSVGMPPRLVGFKWGETDYCLGALPIGGFVKMAGQEDAPLTEEEREKEYNGVPPERWFNNKPVWQRIIVILAGPVANLILAFLLYILLAGMGKQVAESELTARIGLVEENFPAASAELFAIETPGEVPDFTGTPDAIGLKAGDLIATMDGQQLENIEALMIKSVLGGEGTPHVLEIERTGADDQVTRYATNLKPQIMEGEERPRFGIMPFASVIVGDVIEGTPAEAAGLKPDDVIKRTNGEIASTATFIELVQDLPEGESIDLEVERDGSTFPLSLVPHTTGKYRSLIIGPSESGDAAEASKATVLHVDSDYAEETGIQRRDVIRAINGQPISYGEASQLIQDSPGETLSLTVDRPQILMGLGQKASEETFELPVDSIRTIGIAIKPKFSLHRFPASEIIPEAMRQTWNAFATTVHTIKALVAQDVSVRDLGGPVLIYQMTSHFAKRGFGWLVGITALISVNLAVFNLLPLPVLDGGLLVINMIEGIRRKPLNPVFLEKFQMAGLVFIVGLMLFVTWNDVGRAIQSVLP